MRNLILSIAKNNRMKNKRKKPKKQQTIENVQLKKEINGIITK